MNYTTNYSSKTSYTTIS